MISMTGFGSGKAALKDGYVLVEIRTVNHRFLEVRTRAPRELIAGEALIERLLRERLSRGYCLVNLWYEGRHGGSSTIDKGALRTHLESLVEVAKEKELCLTDLVPVLAGAPDVFTTPRVDDEKALAASIEAAFAEAVDGLMGMRITEGDAISSRLSSLLDGLKGQVAALGKLSDGWPKLALKRLKERLRALAADMDVAVDQGRMEAEAAVMAERADVTEELTRLESHLSQMDLAVRSDKPAGRKMEFLIQEMGREINTVASKTALPDVSALVIDIKTDLEKMRELVQNIE